MLSGPLCVVGTRGYSEGNEVSLGHPRKVTTQVLRGMKLMHKQTRDSVPPLGGWWWCPCLVIHFRWSVPRNPVRGVKSLQGQFTAGKKIKICKIAVSIYLIYLIISLSVHPSTYSPSYLIIATILFVQLNNADFITNLIKAL